MSLPPADDLRSHFDFGLNATQESHALRIHHDFIVFDLLSVHAGSKIFSRYDAQLQEDFRLKLAQSHDNKELLTEAIYWPFELAAEGRADLIGGWLRNSGLTCGTFSIEDLAGSAANPLSSAWESRIARYAQIPWVRFVRTAEEIRQAKRDAAIAFYANFQPVVPVPRELDVIGRAYRKGLRSLMLTYNRMDHIGVGCTERVDAGLSMFGRDVVKQCNELGIMIDVSHCGHLTTLDACRYSKQPVNANHTSARGIHDHARGKKDEALRAIASTGGVIGVVAVPHFLSKELSPTINHMLDHIDYIADLVGWEHVALGTDWPWPVPEEVLTKVLGPEYDRSVGFRPQDRIDRTRRLIGFEGSQDLVNITRGLVHRGYRSEQIEGIMGRNALRVFEQVCG